MWFVSHNFLQSNMMMMIEVFECVSYKNWPYLKWSILTDLEFYDSLRLYFFIIRLIRRGFWIFFMSFDWLRQINILRTSFSQCLKCDWFVENVYILIRKAVSYLYFSFFLSFLLTSFYNNSIQKKWKKRDQEKRSCRVKIVLNV